jgi:hypothetical protein
LVLCLKKITLVLLGKESVGGQEQKPIDMTIVIVQEIMVDWTRRVAADEGRGNLIQDI